MPFNLDFHSALGLVGCFATLCVLLIAAIYKLNTRMMTSLGARLDQHLGDSKKCQDNLPFLFAPKVDTEVKITKIFNRQDKLRDEILPGTYVLRQEMLAWNLMNENGFKAITARLDVVCQKLDNFSERKAR